MKKYIVSATLILFSFSAHAAAAQQLAAQQLNTEGFAVCLKEKLTEVNFSQVIIRNVLFPADLLLTYLAVYSGKRLPLIGNFAQTRWSGNYAAEEEALAHRLYEIAAASDAKSSEVLLPNIIFEEALGACGSNDAFCAGLISHNVLRTLGRSATAFRHNSITNRVSDYNPKCFKRDRQVWLAMAMKIQEAMISLRRDGSDDKWGDNYHFFGLFTFSLHEMALYNNITMAWLAARMNQVLNPILAGGAENPAKARIDRDSIAVALKYFQKSFGSRDWNCADPSAYRLSALHYEQSAIEITP